MVNSLVSVCCSTTALRVIFFVIILLLVFFGVFDNFTSFGITFDYIGLIIYICHYQQKSVYAFLNIMQLAMWLFLPRTVNTFQTFLWTQTAGSTSLRDTHTHTEYIISASTPVHLCHDVSVKCKSQWFSWHDGNDIFDWIHPHLGRIDINSLQAI